MSSQEALLDLDFTDFVPPGGKSVREVEIRPDTAIGARTAGRPANHVVFARSGTAPVAARDDAPVLVVEDDAVTRRLLERALEKLGFAVRAVGDSAGFVQAMRRPPLPRLVLLDVELPRTSGFKLLAALRQHPQTSGIPAVMVTARTGNSDIMEGLSLGADGYLSKPLTVAALRATLERVLKGAA